MMATLNQSKIVTELTMQRIGRVAGDVETAASGWAVFREGGHQNVTVRAHSVPDLRDIPGTISRFREKVEHCPVVSDINAPRSEVRDQDIIFSPIH